MKQLFSKIKTAMKPALSIVLVLSLVAVMLPVGLVAFATAGDNWFDVAADTYAGGSGTQADPYLISNGAELARIYVAMKENRSSVKDKYFKLTQDIDLSGKFWTPIGDASYPFNAILDGDGHTISNMSVDTTAQHAGLFAYTKTATINNLHVEGTVTQTSSGAAYVGGIVGYAHTALNIKNCSFSGTITSSTATCGGLVGNAYAVPFDMKNCWTAGTINTSAATTNITVGGLVGNSTGATQAFTNCYSVMTIREGTASGTLNIGGLVGTVGSANVVTFTNCYFAGSVPKFPIMRSTLASNGSAVTNTFYKEGSGDTGRGDAQRKAAEDFTNGTVASLLNAKINELDPALGLRYWGVDSNGVLTFSDLPKLSGLTLSSGAIEFDSTRLNYTVSISNSVSSLTVIPTAASDVTIKGSNGEIIPSGSSQVFDLTTNPTPTITFKAERYDLFQIYTITVTRTDAWDGGVATGYAGGDGSQEAPYLIATPEQLAFLAQQANADTANTSKKYFKLTKDIDLSGSIAWATIGTSTKPFSGYFDGDGHTIDNLYVNLTGNNAGLFGWISGGWAKNLIVSGEVTATEGHCGGIVGRLCGGASLTNCAFIGDVRAITAVGGLVGSTNPYSNAADFAIVNCRTAGSVTATHSTTTNPAVGGLLGTGYYNNGGSVNMTNCYSTMTVRTNSNKPANELVGLGGLCGDSSAKSGAAYTFNNCYFAGNINAAYPIANPVSSTVSALRLFYNEGSYTDTAAGVGIVDGTAVQVSATDIADGSLAGRLNDGVKALKASGVEGLSNWSIDNTNGTIAFVQMPKLLSLTIDCGTIAFDATKLNYRLAVTSAVTSAQITATAEAGATVTVNGETVENGVAKKVDLANNGENEIKISAVRDGLSETYTILVIRPVLVQGVSQWDGTTVATGFAGGSGTKEDPYQIANGEQLLYLSKQTETAFRFKNTYFKLVADIDLGNHNWTPIGNRYINEGNSFEFSGIFDGGNHTIYNLYCSMDANSQYEAAGLFGFVKNATMKNLRVKGFVTNSRPVMSGWTLSAGVVARVDESLVIENCSFTGDVYGPHRSGGLIGNVYNGQITMTGCWTDGGTVTGASAGGLISYVAGKTLNIFNSYSVMTVSGVTAGSAAAGLVGSYNTGAAPASVFKNCHFAGSTAKYPILYNNLTTTQLMDVYYLNTSLSEAPAGELDGAVAKTADEFANGTVTALLNRVPVGATSWENGTNGYPVTVTHMVDDFLTGLLISDCAFDFDPSLFLYTVEIPCSVDKVVFMPTAAEGVVVNVNGQTVESKSLSQEIKLEIGVTKQIDVCATLNGVTKAYTINLVRREQAPAGIWDGTYEVFANRNGGDKVDNAILIENEAQFAFFNAMVSGKTLLLDGKVYTPPQSKVGLVYDSMFFQLTSDIKLNVLEDYANWETNAPYNNWEPIGYAKDPTEDGRAFAGTFDGGCHVISGMYCNGASREIVEGVGLFGTASGATIRNIYVEDAYVYGSQRVGGIVGMIKKNITLQNCHFSGDIKLTTVTATQQSNTGGLLGYCQNTKVNLNSCWSEGTIVGSANVGGLVGYMTPAATSQINNCYSTMTLVSPVECTGVGGLIGYAYDQYTGTINILRSHFAGYVPTTTGSPIVGLKGKRTITLTTSNVYYRADSYAAIGDEDLLAGAEEKSVEEFANGTVTKLLNNCAAYGDFWNWKDGENGYPVSDGKILITDFKSYVDDSEFHDGDWAAKFVNADRCESLSDKDSADNDQSSNGDANNGNGNNNSNGDGDGIYTPPTGERTVYVTAIVLLLMSAASALLLLQRKRENN